MASKSKRKKSTRQTKKTAPEQSFLGDEIFIWLTLAVSILLLISNFGLGGKAGAFAASVLMDIFGWVAYMVPFILFGAVAFIISNKGNLTAYVKTAAGCILTVLVCTFFELVCEEGGFLGSLVTRLLVPAIGVIGTYVVVIVSMIICLIIVTGKSALKGVKKHGGKAYSKAREDVRRKQETSRIRKEKQGEGKKRSERHIEGVSFDTTILKKSPEMKEIKAEPVEAETAKKKPEEVKEKPIAVQPEFVINRGESALLFEEEETCEKPGTVKAVKASKEAEAAAIEEEISGAASLAQAENKPKKKYELPPLSLLKKGSKSKGESDASLRETAMKLQQILQNFGVNVTVTNVSCGPSVTRYELQPEMGVKVSKIVGLADDIKLNLAAADIRIEAPIPGKAAVGIEVPNKENSAVMLRDLLESKEFKENTSKIAFAAGKDIGGKAVVADIAKMPHVLIAGATGSGKSVCINTLIMSILYKASPEEVKLIMIDPKVVELSVYNGIPHLMIPVVTDPKKAAGALNWAVAEMTRRYQEFAEHSVRDMKGYNDKVKRMPDIEEDKPALMPQIVVIVDELADLMMVASGEVEEAICRLAQLARAAGIHLVIATQRPSVNVITGLIKANMPSRIAFSVSSGVDSRTIIDMNGAEKLLGKGDMLFYPAGYQKPARVQGSFVSDKEVQDVVDYLIHNNGDAVYDDEIVTHVNTANVGTKGTEGSEGDERDVYFADAGRLIIDKEKASIGMLQRSFKIGFNRAARIMDQLCEAGVVGGEEGTKPRKILMTPEEFEQYVTKE
ncbi:DNA translocase FtsK [Lachnospiraceae bacterium 42-17]|jgi:S-DNA-T family DNA segregation ATPase FtsK/SpoIIIE|nr:DNA translocase FtsK [Dorea sp.]